MKRIAIVGTIIIALTTLAGCGSKTKETSEAKQSSSLQEGTSNKHFSWTEQDFNSIVVGDGSGKGGEDFEKLKNKFGEPSPTGSIGASQIFYAWSNGKENSPNLEYVSVGVAKQTDGTWLVFSKKQEGLK